MFHTSCTIFTLHTSHPHFKTVQFILKVCVSHFKIAYYTSKLRLTLHTRISHLKLMVFHFRVFTLRAKSFALHSLHAAFTQVTIFQCTNDDLTTKRRQTMMASFNFVFSLCFSHLKKRKKNGQVQLVRSIRVHFLCYR